MNSKIVNYARKNITDRIPTRFDDITKEIIADKNRKYFQQAQTPEVTTYYTIGSVVGEKLNKIF